jgi:hypothetical protein
MGPPFEGGGGIPPRVARFYALDFGGRLRDSYCQTWGGLVRSTVSTPLRDRLLIVALVATLLSCAPAAAAVAPTPIPEGPEAGSVPPFLGTTAKPKAVSAPIVPEHPFMAANGRSNIHVDAYQTDTYRVSGPLGRNMERISTFQGAECASVTFDRAGRIVSICVGLEGPRLVMFDAQTLALLAEMPMPPRTGGGGGNPLTDFSGGGYFYLDNADRAVVSTTTRHIWVVGETSGPLGPGFALQRDYDLSLAVPVGDAIISALPDWSGRIWFASVKGVVGTVDPASGAVRRVDLAEPIGNSFAVDETGGVFIVSDKAMYRFDPAADGSPSVTWREVYENTGVKKPGQSQAGSGTTPTLMGSQYVAITDNADPMDVVVYNRAKTVVGSRLVCVQPVFEKGASATDQSLIGTGRSMVVENNYGYSGPAATARGATTTPGLARVDINDTGTGCRTVWTSAERAPSVVPKLSLANGLVYTYTKPPNPNGTDAWYFTAIDFRKGDTVYKRLAGTGLGFNNHYAPVSLGPDGTAYVGALGGLVLLRDR